MKKYDFDTPADRRHENSLKWDVKENELPMWVADMDFPAAPEIAAAVRRRAEKGVFGYTVVPENWYSAYADWWSRRHGWKVEKEALCFCTGVVPAVTSAVKRLTEIGDKVVLQTPVYDIFFHSVENTGRIVSESPLVYGGGEYRVDFEDLEEKLADPRASLMILCNPHNPVGKIWSIEELAKIGELCEKHGVIVLSDEIHCDLVLPGKRYTPFASVSGTCAKNSVICLAASKAFNLAGLQSAAVAVTEENLRCKIVRGLNADEVAEPNCFAAESAAAAFTYGEAWLCELNAYLAENKKFAVDFINKHTPARAVLSEATYLVWIDCGAFVNDSEDFAAFLRRETGLILSAGAQYRGNGKRFVRLNAACPKSVLADGLERFARGAAAYAAKRGG